MAANGGRPFLAVLRCVFLSLEFVLFVLLLANESAEGNPSLVREKRSARKKTDVHFNKSTKVTNLIREKDRTVRKPTRYKTPPASTIQPAAMKQVQVELDEMEEEAYKLMRNLDANYPELTIKNSITEKEHDDGKLEEIKNQKNHKKRKKTTPKFSRSKEGKRREEADNIKDGFAISSTARARASGIKAGKRSPVKATKGGGRFPSKGHPRKKQTHFTVRLTDDEKIMPSSSQSLELMSIPIRGAGGENVTLDSEFYKKTHEMAYANEYPSEWHVDSKISGLVEFSTKDVTADLIKMNIDAGYYEN